VRHRVVRTGIWLYDGTVEKPVYIVELDHDFWYEIDKADGKLKPGEQPQLNDSGLAYYIYFREVPARPPLWPDSGGLPSIDLACEYAQSRVPSPISWRYARTPDHSGARRFYRL